MYIKLSVLVAVILGFLVVGFQRADSLSRAMSAQSLVSLVPETLGEAHATTRWRNELAGSEIEEGAVYSPRGGGDPVQLDFFRNRMQPHNGIACYMGQGEHLRSEQLVNLRTANGAEVVFDLAVLTDGERLRLVAATECTADGCTEERLTHSAKSPPFGIAVSFKDAQPVRPVIPLSVMVQSADGEPDGDAVSGRLDAELRDAVLKLDLAPLLKSGG